MLDEYGSYGQLEAAMDKIESLEHLNRRLAQHIIDHCEYVCEGNKHLGIESCQWCRDGQCFLQEILEDDDE